jgi:hypothetical protein
MGGGGYGEEGGGGTMRQFGRQGIITFINFVNVHSHLLCVLVNLQHNNAL